MKKTLQEKFWTSNFGKEYILRNSNKVIVNNNLNFFKKSLKKVNKIDSLIEFGANIGLNIKAINKVYKIKRNMAVEINKNCENYLKKIKNTEIKITPIKSFTIKEKFKLVLTKGVLIHINPKDLPNIYSKIYNSCKNKGYILIAEYFNPSPVMVKYRGNKNVLFKRDFAAEILKKYNNLKLIDYGFVYKLDKYPQDKINWFLLKKN